MSSAVLAQPTAPTEALRETIFARASADLESKDAARQIMHLPTQMSRYVPPPDIADIDLRRQPPDGEFAILVRHGQATVTMTSHAGVSEQRTSVPVWNAAVLRDMAVYVVLAAGGSLGPALTCYTAPAWLIRQVELPPSPRERQRLLFAALLAGLTELEAEDLLSAQSAGGVHVVAGWTPESYRVRSAGDASCSLLEWAAAHSAPEAIVLSYTDGQLHACFAAQRAQAHPPVGSGPTSITAVHALVQVAGVRERLGIPANADAFDIYDWFAQRGLIDYAPLPTDLLNMQHVWNSEHAR